MNTTPPTKKQKRYTSRLMILEDIHAAQRKKLKFDQKAEVADVIIQEKRKADDPTWQRDDEERILVLDKAARMDTRIKRLSATMAAFLTEPLGGDMAERSVTLQRVGVNL